MTNSDVEGAIVVIYPTATVKSTIAEGHVTGTTSKRRIRDSTVALGLRLQ